MKTNADNSAVDKLNGLWQNAGTTTTSGNNGWSEHIVISLSVSVLVFTAFVLLLATLLVYKKKASAISTLRIFGIVSIIGMSSFLLIAGYSNDQLTPIIGLFGAIAGYLLGKETSDPRDKNPAPGEMAPPNDPPPQTPPV